MHNIFSAVASGDFIYVFAHGKRAYRFNPAVTSTQVRYVPLSALPLPEWFTFDVCSYGPFIFLIGGASTGVWSRAIYRYDTRSDTWFQLPDMIRQRRRTAVAIVNIGAVTTENATAAATITSTPAAQPDKDIITNSSS